jgi:hypothetical protein
MSDVDDLKLTLAEAQQKVVEEAKAPKITLKGIIDKVVKREFFYSGLFTVCVVTLANGFKVVGTAGCASPDNYNADIGNTFAYEDALKKIWSLEGYLLREQLHKLGY